MEGGNPKPQNQGHFGPRTIGCLAIYRSPHLHKLGGQIPFFLTLAALADKYGPIFTLRLGKNRALVISNCEAVKDCFTKNNRVFATRLRSTQGKYLGYNHVAFGFSPYGPYWLDMRKMVVVELLSSCRLETLKHVHSSEVDAFVKGLHALCNREGHNGLCSTNVVISDWIQHLTLNVMTRMIDGKRYFDSGREGGEGEEQNIGKIVKEFMVAGNPVAADVIGFPDWIDFKGEVKEMKRIVKELDSLMGSWVEEHYAKKETNSSHKHDFIDVMLSVIEDNSQLGYTRETIIKATSMGHRGFLTQLLVNLWKLHRDPSVWADPEVFCPNRFLTRHVDIDASGQHFEFIPFGSGRRSCPGVTFGLQVTHLTLGRLLQGFELATPLDMPVDLTEELATTLPKATSLEINVTPRLPFQLYQG